MLKLLPGKGFPLSGSKVRHKMASAKPGRPRAIVLDLDNTLIFTPQGTDWYEKLSREAARRVIKVRVLDSRERGSGNYSDYYTIKRPHVNTFLAFCFAEYDYVIVWSAGERNYVLPIVRNLFRHVRRPHLVWTRDEVEEDCKPLERLLQRTDLPDSLHLGSVLIVDDIKRNFLRNRGNGVLIPPYEPPPTVSGILGDDRTLLQLKSWLSSERVRNAEDVRILSKINVFPGT